MSKLSGIQACVILMTGCIIGKVEAIVDDSGNTVPVENAFVYLKECPTCSLKYIGQTDEDGYYYYDAYAPGNSAILPTGTTGTYEILVNSSAYSGEPLGVYHRPDWQYYSNSGEYYTIVPTIYVVDHNSPNLSAAYKSDNDNDGLNDAAEELIFGTTRLGPDSDNDGLADSTEVYGYDWVDFAALGADPIHKDAFFEADYSIFSGIGGFPTPPIVSAMVDFFEDHIDVPNPDGVGGIDLHIIKDTSQGSDLCDDLTASPDRNPHYAKTMRYVRFCANPISPYSGIAEFPFDAADNSVGTRMEVAGGWDQNPNNDFVEQDAGYSVSVFAHEFGHTSALSHGGGQEWAMNNKVNYPSLMNYAHAYSGTVCDNNRLLDADCARFSDGVLPTLSPSSVDETVPFGAYAIHLDYYDGGDPIVQYSAGGNQYDVDWNHDTSISASSYADSCALNHCSGAVEYIRDYDDHLAIQAGLQKGLPLYTSTQGLEREVGEQGPHLEWHTPNYDDFCYSAFDECTDWPTLPGVEPWRDSAPERESGLNYADEFVLTKFTKRGSGALRELIARLGLSRKAAAELASRFYHQDDYLGVGEEKRRAKLTSALTRAAGRHVEVEFIDCPEPSEKELTQLLRGHVESKSNRRLLKVALQDAESVELCR
ncbi:MAG: hypothetical protein AAGF92_14945 [Myxococcota bacterium]